MLTETLIKPFFEDLEGDGVEDTTTYEYGFRAGMAALSDILSQNIDKQPQFFVYLGMAISEGAQWIESQVSESPENTQPIEFVAPKEPRERQPTPSSDLKETDWDYIPMHDDLPASLIQKYSKKNVYFTTPDNPGPEKPGSAILDLCSNRLQIIETNGNQVKRPYYIKLR